MGQYTGELARRIMAQGAGQGAELYVAELTSLTSIRIGDAEFTEARVSPDLHADAEDIGRTVLAAMLGGSFYVICRL